MWLNLNGREAGQRKLKNTQKMHVLCFLAIFELMSASPENDFCLVFWFLVFGYWVVQKIFFLFFCMKKTKEVHMR